MLLRELNYLHAMKWLALLLCLFVGSLSAQNTLPVESMSQATLTYATAGHQALFSNQAGLHDVRGLSVQASALQRYFTDGIMELHAGAAMKLGEYTGGGVYFRRFGDDIFSEQTIGLAIGRKLFDGFALGIGLETYQLAIENYGNDQAFNTQIGFQADISKRIKIGSHFFLPLGEAAQWSNSNQSVFNFDVSVLADDQIEIKAGVRKVNDVNLGIKAGLSWRPTDFIVIHTGVLSHPAQYSFGGGLRVASNIDIVAMGMYQPNLGWSSGVQLNYLSKRK